MQKRNLTLTLILGMFLTNLASAYNSGLSDFLYQLNEQSVIVLVVFLISFVLVNFSLVRIFKDNKVVPAVISLAISFLVAYKANQTNFYIDFYWLKEIIYWFQNLGFIGTLIILGLTIWFIKIIYDEFKKKKVN